MVPSSFGCGWSVFAINATFAPQSAAAFFAISRPMPRLPPLMIMVFPERLWA